MRRSGLKATKYCAGIRRRENIKPRNDLKYHPNGWSKNPTKERIEPRHVKEIWLKHWWELGSKEGYEVERTDRLEKEGKISPMRIKAKEMSQRSDLDLERGNLGTVDANQGSRGTRGLRVRWQSEPNKLKARGSEFKLKWAERVNEFLRSSAWITAVVEDGCEKNGKRWWRSLRERKHLEIEQFARSVGARIGGNLFR
jgi:hypothetical protein